MFGPTPQSFTVSVQPLRTVEGFEVKPRPVPSVPGPSIVLPGSCFASWIDKKPQPTEDRASGARTCTCTCCMLLLLCYVICVVDVRLLCCKATVFRGEDLHPTHRHAARGSPHSSTNMRQKARRDEYAELAAFYKWPSSDSGKSKDVSSASTLILAPCG